MTTPRDPSHSIPPEAPDPDEVTATASTANWAGVRTESRWRIAYAVAFAIVLVGGCAAAVLNPALRNVPDVAVMDGSWAEAYQAEFDAASPLLDPARTVWGLIDAGLFGQGRPGVLIGTDGWLFSREEYATVPDAAGAIALWSDRIALVRDELAQLDVHLVVAPVPSKAAVVGEHAPAPLPTEAARRYDTLLDALEERGVVVSDLRPALGRVNDPFLRTDTHWTPAGAAAAAQAIATTVRERAPFAGLGETSFETTLTEPEERWGDLTTFLDLGPLLEHLGPPPDLIAMPRTTSLAPPATDLFGAVEVPVTLVGTSFSADPAWNTVGALREALGSDVIDAALTGLGPWEPMHRYLTGEALRSSPPEVVIWEIPERYVTLEGHVPEAPAW
ncbi:MAG: alginate O-acetyltransferase [Trueperaceae bacterium]|nr:MAG: alginate O-acetyltransferase [Trueperaceae bacterium]